MSFCMQALAVVPFMRVAASDGPWVSRDIDAIILKIIKVY